jgi:indolepyruvate ferredoxin oxidoreductase
MKEKIVNEVGEEGAHFIDATRIATALLGDSIGGNLFLLGFAWQRGLVPVSAEALEAAIELNGVAVDFNREAFLWGRRCAHDPSKVLAAAGLDRTREGADDLDSLIDDRMGRLVAYQNETYAGEYRELVERVRRADPHAERAESLSRAVARNLYKLMAYKDEYEVARLYSDGEFRRQLEAQFEGDFELRFNLAPPLLSRRDPSSGEPRKREFGSWVMTLFGGLAKLRFLRGTALDPFGYTAERRREREDIREYREMIAAVLAELDASNYATACELAALPAKLRGFGHVKERNRSTLLERREELLRRLRGEVPASMVKIVDAA